MKLASRLDGASHGVEVAVVKHEIRLRFDQMRSEKVLTLEAALDIANRLLAASEQLRQGRPAD